MDFSGVKDAVHARARAEVAKAPSASEIVMTMINASLIAPGTELLQAGMSWANGDGLSGVAFAMAPVLGDAAPLARSAKRSAGTLAVFGTKHSGVELAAAIEVSRRGRRVVLKDAVGRRSAAGATADLLVDGVAMDIYSPEAGTSIANVYRTMAKKNNQAQGIVLDLSMWDGALDELGDVTARLQGKLRAQGSTVNINEVIIVGR